MDLPGLEDQDEGLLFAQDTALAAQIVSAMETSHAGVGGDFEGNC